MLHQAGEEKPRISNTNVQTIHNDESANQQNLIGIWSLLEPEICLFEFLLLGLRLSFKNELPNQFARRTFVALVALSLFFLGESFSK